MLGRVVRSRLFIAVLSVSVGFAVAGGIAFAAIPNPATGLIAACYPKAAAAKPLRLIDYQGGQRCTASESMISWPSSAMRWRGSYSAAVAYQANDVVQAGGSSYIAKRAVVGHAPPDVADWALMASKGNNGSAGPGSREEQVTMFTNLSGASGNFGQCVAQWLSVFNGGCKTDGTVIDPSGDLLSAVTIDRDRYDPAAQFYFEATFGVNTDAQLCLRLYDVTASSAVSGSNFCETTPGTHIKRVAVTLPSGSHQYIVQQNAVSYEGVVVAARIIVQL